MTNGKRHRKRRCKEERLKARRSGKRDNIEKERVA